MAKPTQDEIEHQLELAEETEHDTRWRAMTYEQGVAETIRWMQGDSEDPPMEE